MIRNQIRFIEIEVGFQGLEEWTRRYGISDGWHVLDSKQEPNKGYERGRRDEIDESKTAGSKWNSTRGDFKRDRQSDAKNEATIEERLMTSRIELEIKLIFEVYIVSSLAIVTKTILHWTVLVRLGRRAIAVEVVRILLTNAIDWRCNGCNPLATSFSLESTDFFKCKFLDTWVNLNSKDQQQNMRIWKHIDLAKLQISAGNQILKLITNFLSRENDQQPYRVSKYFIFLPIREWTRYCTKKWRAVLWLSAAWYDPKFIPLLLDYVYRVLKLH